MIDLRNGNCYDEFKTLEEDSIDAVICDPPYNVTSASWDSQPLDWEAVWEELHRICKQDGAFVFTAQQPFTTRLVQSNIDNFRHELVWIKEAPSGALNASKQPMPKHEDIVVFYRKAGAYNSLSEPMDNPIVNSRAGSTESYIYQIRETTIQTETGFQTSVIHAKRDNRQDGLDHPTQKPVELMSQLVKMYSDEGDTILDFTMGSGTTGVAATLEDRSFIGFETDEEYFEAAERRIQNAKTQKDQFDKFFE